MDAFDPKHDAILNRLLERVLADRSRGVARARAEYEALFPGFESWVAEELDRLFVPTGGAAQAGSERGDPPTQQTTSAAALARDSRRAQEPHEGRAAAGRRPRIGPYSLLSELGRGGQGSVYLAADERLGRQVALKLLSSLGSLKPDQLARFQREAELASRLDHPGIATVYESGLDEHVPYVAMRYVSGETLQAHLVRLRGRAPRSQAELDQSIRWVESAARIVHFAHLAGVVHRDIKPSNLMIAPDGEHVVLLDFGLARDIESVHSSLTQSGDVFGTPAYMAPEQVESASPNQDPRSDVWALGVVLYEVVTLRQPFSAATQAGLYRAILSLAPEDPRRLEPRVSRDLAVVLATAIAKAPQHRYRTALDLADDLRAVLESRSIAARPTPLAGRAWRWLRREPARALLVAGLVLAGLLAAGMGGFLLARAPAIEVGEAELSRRELDQHVADAFGRRDVERSLETLRAFPPEDPRYTPQVLALAFVLCAGEDAPPSGPQEALKLAERLAPSDSEPDAADRIRGLALDALGRREEAERLRASLGVPAGPLTSFLEGMRALGPAPTLASAEACLDLLERAQTLSRRPLAWVLEQKVLVATISQRSATAQLAADGLKAHFADSASAWYFIGLARHSVDEARSRAAYRRAAELDPTFPQPRAALAVGMQYDGDADAARLLHEEALRDARPGTGPWSSMVISRSKILVLTKDFDQALQVCTEALQVDPDRADLWVQKSAALRALGRLDEARDAAQIALDIEPEHLEARAALQKL